MRVLLDSGHSGRSLLCCSDMNAQSLTRGVFGSERCNLLLCSALYCLSVRFVVISIVWCCCKTACSNDDVVSNVRFPSLGREKNIFCLGECASISLLTTIVLHNSQNKDRTGWAKKVSPYRSINESY